MDPPGQPQGGKKKKKSKKVTVSLEEFLDSTSKPVFTNKSWADEVATNTFDDSHWDSASAAVDVSKLPKAPRAAFESSGVDLERIPKHGPWTLFVGNLPYDTEECEIQDFLQCPGSDIRLPREGTRLKGFGYAEMPSREAMITALGMDGKALKGRGIKVDFADEKDDGRSGGGSRYDDDRTAGDWRSGPPRENYEPPRGRGGEDRSRYDDGYNRSRGDERFDRGDGYDRSRGDDRFDRGDGYDRSRGDERFDRGRGRSPGRADEGNWRSSAPQREAPRNDRSLTSGDSRRDEPASGFDSRGREEGSPRSDRDGHSSRHDDRSGSRDRRSGNEYRRGSNEDRQDERHGDRGRDTRGDWHSDRQPGRFDDHGGPGRYDDRRPGRFDDRRPGRFDERGPGRFDERGPGRYNDRGRNEDEGRDQYGGRGRSDNNSRDGSPGKPAERPKLNLQKRSKPIEAEAGSSTQSAIFGGARPVDTAAKERELETRKEQVKPVPKEDDREERRTERASRPSQPEKAEVKSWRDAPKPEINTRSNGRKGSSTSQDEKSNGVKNSTTSQNSSAKASDQDASSDADGWQEASHKRVPNTRGGGARRGSGQRDRRDDRGSRNGRRERDEAESTKPNVVPADPPAKSAWGGSNKSARPAPVVKESKKDWTDKNAFGTLEAEEAD